MNESHESREGEVDLMDELLEDAGENFEELSGNDVGDEKIVQKRRKHEEDKSGPKLKEFENGKASKFYGKSSSVKTKLLKVENTQKSKGKTNVVNAVKKDNEHDFDLASDISSENEGDLTMSNSSHNSSISRESSVDRENVEEGEVSGEIVNRSPSEVSIKSANDDKMKSTAEVKSPKKKYDYTTKINYLFREARFFLMKSNNEENINISKGKGVWSTPVLNEGRLNQAFKESRNVILIYSVKESGKFCGFCRLAGESRRDLPMVNWFLPPGFSIRALGGVFEIDWISQKDLPFTKTLHLYNPWNEGKPVKIGRDGQEIEPHVAEELCRLFPEDSAINLTPILYKSKKSSKEHKSHHVPLRSFPLQIPGEKRGRLRGRGSFRGGRIGAFRGGMFNIMRRKRFTEDFAMRMRRLRGFRGRGDKSSGFGGEYIRELSRERSPGMYRSDSRRELGPSYNSGGPSHKLSSSFKSYHDFMRDVKDFPPPRSHSSITAMAFPPPPPFDPIAPPRYYDGPPMPEYPSLSRSRSEKRSSDDMYDRSVDEFLLRTRERSRDHSRERRYRERR